MAKRANGEGSIRKHRNKWLVTFPTGLYQEKENKDGLKVAKRQYIYKYCDTQAEALAELHKLQAEKNMGINHRKGDVKTGDWLNEWIEKTKAPKLAPSTLTSYRNSYLNHLKPALGEIPLKKLETYHIQRALDQIGGSLSTFVKNYNVIHGGLERAVELGMIAKNPCKGVNFPADDTKPMRVLTQDEQRRYVEALEGEFYRPLLLTYLYTGMRLGEAIPLQWCDVDLENRTIRVNKKVIAAHDHYKHSAKQEIQDFCKTKSSKRTIVITAGLATILAEHKENEKELAAKLGEEWSEDELVFKNTRRHIVQASNLDEINARIYRKAGIEGATNHSLRHTYATRAFEAGVDIKAISEQLGHKNVKTTYNIYVHLLNDTKVKEIDKLAEIDRLLQPETGANVIQFPTEQAV